ELPLQLSDRHIVHRALAVGQRASTRHHRCCEVLVAVQRATLGEAPDVRGSDQHRLREARTLRLAREASGVGEAGVEVVAVLQNIADVSLLRSAGDKLRLSGRLVRDLDLFGLLSLFGLVTALNAAL